MDGSRIQQYWSNEIQAMLETYKQFQVLIPADGRDGAAHNGEDGRYVETLIREYLKRFLPKELEVLTGFILRPAVKTGVNDRSRSGEQDTHSSQLDIIIYDSGKYPIFQRFGDNVIVPPEGVIGIISVKKKLRRTHITEEICALKLASKLCHCKNESGPLRGPFLAIISMDSVNIQPPKIFEKLENVYDSQEDYFDNLVGYIGSLKGWTVFKKRPSSSRNCTRAKYIYFNHKDEEKHLGLQFLLTGLLSVYYDKSRTSVSRPGFTAFPSGRPHDRILGDINVRAIREGGE